MPKQFRTGDLARTSAIAQRFQADANTGEVTSNTRPVPPSVTYEGTDGDEAWRTFVRELQTYFGLTRDQVGVLMGVSGAQQMASIMKGRQKFRQDFRQSLYDNYRNLEGFLLQNRSRFKTKVSLFEIMVQVFSYGGTPHSPPNSELLDFSLMIPVGMRSVFPNSPLTHMDNQVTTGAQARFDAFWREAFDGFFMVIGDMAIKVGKAGENEEEPWRPCYEYIYDRVNHSFLDNAEACNRLATMAWTKQQNVEEFTESLVEFFGRPE